jgi:hypothetical protein
MKTSVNNVCRKDRQRHWCRNECAKGRISIQGCMFWEALSMKELCVRGRDVPANSNPVPSTCTHGDSQSSALATMPASVSLNAPSASPTPAAPTLSGNSVSLWVIAFVTTGESVQGSSSSPDHLRLGGCWLWLGVWWLGLGPSPSEYWVGVLGVCKRCLCTTHCQL